MQAQTLDLERSTTRLQHPAPTNLRVHRSRVEITKSADGSVVGALKPKGSLRRLGEENHVGSLTGVGLLMEELAAEARSVKVHGTGNSPMKSRTSWTKLIEAASSARLQRNGEQRVQSVRWAAQAGTMGDSCARVSAREAYTEARRRAVRVVRAGKLSRAKSTAARQTDVKSCFAPAVTQRRATAEFPATSMAASNRL